MSGRRPRGKVPLILPCQQPKCLFMGSPSVKRSYGSPFSLITILYLIYRFVQKRMCGLSPAPHERFRCCFCIFLDVFFIVFHKPACVQVEVYLRCFLELALTYNYKLIRKKENSFKEFR